MKGINPNCFGEGDHNLPNCECRLIYERIRNAENSVALPHTVAMSLLGLEIPSQRTGFLIGSVVLVVIGVTLIALAPTKKPVERASAVAA